MSYSDDFLRDLVYDVLDYDLYFTYDKLGWSRPDNYDGKCGVPKWLVRIYLDSSYRSLKLNICKRYGYDFDDFDIMRLDSLFKQVAGANLIGYDVDSVKDKVIGKRSFVIQKVY